MDLYHHLLPLLSLPKRARFPICCFPFQVLRRLTPCFGVAARESFPFQTCTGPHPPLFSHSPILAFSHSPLPTPPNRRQKLDAHARVLRYAGSQIRQREEAREKRRISMGRKPGGPVLSMASCRIGWPPLSLGAVQISILLSIPLLYFPFSFFFDSLLD